MPFRERSVTTFENIHQSIEFLTLFRVVGRGTFPYDFEMIAHRDIPAEDNINAARHDFPYKRGPLVNEEEDGDIEISRGLFFSSPRVSELTLNSPVTEHRQCGNSTEIWWQKNRTYHNGMGGTHAIVETLQQFFDIQSTGFSIAIPLLRFAAELRVSRETLVIVHT